MFSLDALFIYLKTFSMKRMRILEEDIWLLTWYLLADPNYLQTISLDSSVWHGSGKHSPFPKRCWFHPVTKTCELSLTLPPLSNLTQRALPVLGLKCISCPSHLSMITPKSQEEPLVHPHCHNCIFWIISECQEEPLMHQSLITMFTSSVHCLHHRWTDLSKGEFRSSSSQKKSYRLCFLFHVLCDLHSALCLRGWSLRTRLKGSVPFGFPLGFTSWILKQELGGLRLLNHYEPGSLQQRHWHLRRLSWEPIFPKFMAIKPSFSL